MIIKNWVINLILLTSLAGLLDSGYLTLSHFQGTEAGCFLVHGCDIVLSSRYSEVFGIPVALGGFVFYLIIFLGTFVYNSRREIHLIQFLSYLSIFGFLGTLWFIYLQAFVLRAFCSYCLISATTSTLLLILGIYVLRKPNRFAENKEEMLES